MNDSLKCNKEDCRANLKGGCTILKYTYTNNKCPFYKTQEKWAEQEDERIKRGIEYVEPSNN